MNKWVCQTPTSHCSGGTGVVIPSLHGLRLHQSPEDAFRCYARYLKHVRGYIQIGGREFSPPGGGPVEVLTRKSKYGARLRHGKEGRWMPKGPRNSGIVRG